MGQFLGARSFFSEDYAHGAFAKLERDHRIVGLVRVRVPRSGPEIPWYRPPASGSPRAGHQRERGRRVPEFLRDPPSRTAVLVRP
ncbi:hypothetical protein, partial [Streptomyces altiplanensis]